MEACAKYQYKAAAADEISFHKGATIKILTVSGNWYEAELNGVRGLVPKNFIDLKIPSWYKGNISRHDAIESLVSEPVGGFLIRSKRNAVPGDFSVSVRRQVDVLHLKVQLNSRGQYHLWSEKFLSLNQLVDYYKANSISKQGELFLQETHREQSSEVPVENPHEAAPPATPPRSSCSPVPPLPQTKRPTPRRRVRALYDFKAEEPDELEFSAGDVIEVLEVLCDFWWRGQLRDKTGLFPSNYTIDKR